MFNTRYHLDKIIITAMDRFVWFVLLVVTTHLVTELTRTTNGSYTRSSSSVTHQYDAISEINLTRTTHKSNSDILWPDVWTIQLHLNKPQNQQQKQSQKGSSRISLQEHQRQRQEWRQEHLNQNQNQQQQHSPIVLEERQK